MHVTRTSCIAGLALRLNLVLATQSTQPFEGQALTSPSGLLPAYDYVIVGGGVSGLTVANRLSEDQTLSILVIEAGAFDQNEDFIAVPALAGGAVGTKYDWNLTYSPNLDTANRAIPIPQGKVVGGSSLLNRMVFDRGSSADYDRWEILGNPGWGWADLLSYFKKSETFTPPTPDIVGEWSVTYNASVHGESGNVQASYSPWIWPSTKHFISAIKESGIHIPNDGASGDAVGGYFSPHNQDPATATRSDARRASWDPVSTRPGLHLITGHMATRLVSQETADGPIITAVEIAASSSAPRTTVNVRKETILAAGAIHTPQILQLSGIGDPALLAGLDIPTVANVSGVGRNFQDHAYIPVVFSFDFPLVAANLSTNATFAEKSRSIYNDHKTGPYADATADFLAFLPARNITDQVETIYQNAQGQDPNSFLEADTPTSVQTGYTDQHKLLTEGIAALNEAQIEILFTDGTFVIGLQHPFSRGSVRLASTDPFAAPIADPAYLRNPIDLQLLIAGVKYARSLATTSPSLSVFNPVEQTPGADVVSDADIEAYIRGGVAPLFHPSGSCSVGRYETGGVVDAEFRVHGVRNLRVVDASVYPVLPATHIQSSVYAVAEMALPLDVLDLLRIS